MDEAAFIELFGVESGERFNELLGVERDLTKAVALEWQSSGVPVMQAATWVMDGRIGSRGRGS